ncbi:hypothetical protein BGZ49_010551 [Haplosporangium sp. Z 27]|nr:hypothetical protein BGZ49_010551 [Haplosporangium sp. Z 27]
MTIGFTSASPNLKNNNNEKTDAAASKSSQSAGIENKADVLAMMDPARPGVFQVAAMDITGKHDEQDLNNIDEDDEAYEDYEDDEYDGYDEDYEDDENGEYDGYDECDEDEDEVEDLNANLDDKEDEYENIVIEDENINENVNDNKDAIDFSDLEQVGGFNYADPLLVPMQDKQRQIASRQIERRAIVEKPTVESKVKHSAINATMTAEDTKLSALTTPKPGGACIDSFVNFTLLFRDRCSIQCLRAMDTASIYPDFIQFLSCFGCSNFVVQGFYTLGYDCVGLFTPSTKITKSSVTGDKRLKDLQDNVNPADANLYPLNFGDMMKSLHQVDVNELEDWFAMGQNLYHVVEKNNHVAKSQSDDFTLTAEEKVKIQSEKMTLDRALFNQFVGKAANFANWTLTPEIIESSGVYDRLQDMNLM